MRVLVFEPKFVGHFLGFAAEAAKAVAATGCEVDLVISAEARGTDAAAVKLATLPVGVNVDYSSETPKVYKRWTNARLEAAALAAALQRVQPDWVVVPSADFLLNGLLLRGGLRRRMRRLAGADLILHNCRQAYPSQPLRETFGRLIDRLAVSAASFARVHTVDEYAVSPSASAPVALWGSPPRWLPHFYDRTLSDVDQSQARERLGLEAGCRWIGSVGNLGTRKGTVQLIQAFARMRPDKTTRLALLGRLCGASRAALKDCRELVDQGLICVRDEFLSEGDFLDFFPAMDAVWAGYPWQVGMASTLLFAADAGRPVVAIDYGGLGWTVRNYGLGTVCSRDTDALAGAIRDALRPDASLPHPEGVERLLQRNTTERFASSLTAGIRAAMGQAVATSEAVGG